MKRAHSVCQTARADGLDPVRVKADFVAVRNGSVSYLGSIKKGPVSPLDYRVFQMASFVSGRRDTGTFFKNRPFLPLNNGPFSDIGQHG